MSVAGLIFIQAASVVANNITYQVNVGVQRALGNFNAAAGDTVVVSGTFSATDWTTTATLTPSPGDTNLYIGTFSNDVSANGWVQYKFIINPGGNSSAGQLIWESGNNRYFQVTVGNQTLPVVYFDEVTNAPTVTVNPSPVFYAGVDMSHLKFFEDRGITYRVDGEAGDAISILRDLGINCVRLRLFTSSPAQAASDPYNYINNLDYTLPLAIRVKAAGVKLLLDLHYSDSWADPGKQTKPSGWTNLNFAQLKAQIRSYNSNTIAILQAAGAMPDLVQVGNEITPGMLWSDGRVGGAFDNPTQWSQLAQLITNAIQGIRDAAGTNTPGIMVHIDRGGDWVTTKWFFDNLAAQGVPFDMIGLSYYPFWHGTFADVQTCLNNAAARYQKPVVIAETAFPFTYSTNILGFTATTNGQMQFTAALGEIVRRVPGRWGAGVFWWGTEYQSLAGYPLAGFDSRSLFGTDGNILPAASALGQLSSPLVLSTSVSNSTLRLSWPLSGAAMSLVTSTSPSPASAWEPVASEVNETNLIFQTTVPVGSEPVRLYRLQSE